MQVSRAVVIAAAAAALMGCGDEHGGTGAATAHGTTSAAAASTPAPTASAPASAAPTATASAAPVMRSDCPKGSAGEGTLKSPCEAKGKDRLMEVTWTGKMDDKGPSFRVVNKSTQTILYGRIVVYFYDKAGKQLDVPDDKPRPNQVCFGNLFSGIMKPGEKATVTFSCVAKKHVPEGAAAIEGEMQMVGFADSTEKKSEYYWRNNDLTPDVRPKGGVK